MTTTPITSSPSSIELAPRRAEPGVAVVRRAVVAAGLVGIAGIHLADLPDKMSEVPYLGWAYVGLIAASLVLAELVARRRSPAPMAAAGALSAAVILGYVVNRTVGMPNAMDDIGNWTEPLGLVSLLVEGVVLWFSALAVRAGLDRSPARDAA